MQNLSIEPVNNKLVRLKWDRSIDADVIHGGRVYIRHSNLTDGSGTFQNSVDFESQAKNKTPQEINFKRDLETSNKSSHR